MTVFGPPPGSRREYERTGSPPIGDDSRRAFQVGERREFTQRRIDSVGWEAETDARIDSIPQLLRQPEVDDFTQRTDAMVASVGDQAARLEAAGNRLPSTTQEMRAVAPLQDDTYGVLRAENQARAEGPAGWRGPS